jgi:hypothetical protein
MTTKHTPGPWVVLQNPMGNDCITAEDCRICDMPGWDDDYADEEAANTRLIAAAPELLAALNALLDDVGRANSMLGAVQARAAIAKATGETQ